MSHRTVLLTEAVLGLQLQKNSVVVDATIGSAGHAREICRHLDSRGHYIGIDADAEAVAVGHAVLAGVRPKVTLLVGNFASLDDLLAKASVAKRSVSGIIADLGWRMEQFAGGGKGFSFRHDEPLLMTYGNPAIYPFTAHDIVNDWSEEQLATIIRSYGEERYASRIARAIVSARRLATITTTGALVAVIVDAVPTAYRHGRIHPATRTFQALRMTVNDELSTVESLIKHSLSYLAPCGRLAIITFHSLEDRLVKHRFRELMNEGQVTILTKRPITPTTAEVKENPRARSAKLRIIEKSL
jgi:16S rRNA (cytosine1402-N4)-methyltransferase